MAHKVNLKTYKLIFIGSANVGKTTIIRSYTYGAEYDNICPTIGAEFCNIQRSNYSLDIWDTAGQERFISMIRAYCQDIAICVFTYDITNPESIQNLKKIWIPYVINSLSDTKEPPVFIFVGNKMDLVSRKLKTHAPTIKQRSFVTNNKYWKNINVKSIRNDIVDLKMTLQKQLSEKTNFNVKDVIIDDFQMSARNYEEVNNLFKMIFYKIENNNNKIHEYRKETLDLEFERTPRTSETDPSHLSMLGGLTSYCTLL
jgi:small GTP-binding protein